MIFTTFEISTGAVIEVINISPLLVSRMHQRQQEYNKKHPHSSLDICPFVIITLCTMDTNPITLEDVDNLSLDDYILINESINAQTNNFKSYL